MRASAARASSSFCGSKRRRRRPIRGSASTKIFLLASRTEEAWIRGVASSSDAAEALERLQEGCRFVVDDEGRKEMAIDESLCVEIIEAALDRGNVGLAMSIYESMRTSTVGSSRTYARGGTLQWPSCTLPTVELMLQGMCQKLRVSDALRILSDVRSCGIPRGEEVAFGYTARCPLCPTLPLAVVKPQDGCSKATCSGCRHEYELYSGTVVKMDSDVLGQEENMFLKAARAVGVWKSPHIEATHEIVVEAPDTSARSFRVATATADVPAQCGQRVTVIGAPVKARKGKVYAARAPGKRPGEPMLLLNHDIEKEVDLLRAPPSGTVAAIAGSAVLGNAYLLPELKKLPAGSVSVSAARQQLLSQHDQLMDRLAELMLTASEEVRNLARFWQLQNKIEAVGDPEAYNARLGTLVAARKGAEERLSKLIMLLDSYAKLVNMIEIEVELGDASTASIVGAVKGIEEELVKLQEVEELQESLQMQAQANDEIERLLRSTG